MPSHADIAIVGAGIVGLAHAWAAARRGLSVVLFERHPQARCASIRNFGMIWPIGQPAGELYLLAMRGRDRWIELSQKAGVWVGDCGSLHLATSSEEEQVLVEFAELAAEANISSEMFTSSRAAARCPAVRGDCVLAALYSPTECSIDPRQALSRIPSYLADRFNVDLHFDTTITHIDGTILHAADGRSWRAERVFVCSGSDFETLFPASFAGAGLRRCNHQMLRTGPQPGRWRLGPHLAGGLAWCHERSFANCPGLSALRHRLAEAFPRHAQLGIRPMAAQNHLGEVLLGHSHEYGDAVDVFDKQEIDALMLDSCARLFRLPDERMVARWHATTIEYPTGPIFSTTPQPGVTIQVAPGDAGMTLAFGLADAWWEVEG